MKGPGKLLGSRAMHKKIRRKYNLFVTRDTVYDMLYKLDPDVFKSRGGIEAKKKRGEGNFSSNWANWAHSHDKLKGYQNSTIPIPLPSMAAWIQPVESCCGCGFGRVIVIHY